MEKKYNYEKAFSHFFSSPSIFFFLFGLFFFFSRFFSFLPLFLSFLPFNFCLLACVVGRGGEKECFWSGYGGGSAEAGVGRR